MPEKQNIRVMGVYEQEGLGINHIRLKTLQQTMINYSTERGLQHRCTHLSYDSAGLHIQHCRQSHLGTWLFLHTDVVCLKKMKIFGRVFIRSEADTFATLAFQASE